MRMGMLHEERQAGPPYRFVIPDGTTTPTHAETDGSFDGDAPEPGTSIEWTDLHMPVFNT